MSLLSDDWPATSPPIYHKIDTRRLEQGLSSERSILEEMDTIERSAIEGEKNHRHAGHEDVETGRKEAFDAQIASKSSEYEAGE